MPSTAIIAMIAKGTISVLSPVFGISGVGAGSGIASLSPTPPGVALIAKE